MATAQKQQTYAVTVSRLINAPRDRVFATWSDPEEQKKIGPEGLKNQVFVSDSHVGGHYRIEMVGPDGERFIARGVYKVVEPPSKLVYTWKWDSDPDLETLVTVLFKEKGRKTEITVTHEGFPTEAHRKDHEEGWSQSLDQFVALFSDGR